MNVRGSTGRTGTAALASLWLMLAGATAMAANTHRERQTFDSAAMLSATVTVETISHVHIDRVGDSVWTKGNGSGVLVSAEHCELWTNHHVVDEAAFVEIRVHDGDTSRTIPARVLGSRPVPDVAVLKLEHCEGIAEAPLGDSNHVVAGDTAFAAGNPYGANPNSLTQGIVSHAERYLDNAWPYLQTDAAIGLGSSGGPLFNEAGEVIGLNAAVVTGFNNRSTGFGYAIPINIVAQVAQQIRSGTVAHTDAGLTNLVNSLDAESAALLGVPGNQSAVIVARTPSDGPAAGHLYARDTIYRLNGRSVQSTRQFERAIAKHQSGEALELKLIRNGTSLATTIELSNLPLGSETTPGEPYDGLLGIELEYWGDESGALGEYKHPIITHIYDRSPAHRARVSALKKSTRAGGAVVARFLLRVEMVTGAVFQGEYTPITDKLTLDEVAARAHAADAAMLLEVTSWRPANPRRPGHDMGFHNATLHRIVPAPSPPVAATPELDATDIKHASTADKEV